MSAFNLLATRGMRGLGAVGAGRPVAYPPEETALLLVGTQRDLIDGSTTVDRIAALLGAAHRARLTIIHAPGLPPTPENGVAHPTPSQHELLIREALREGTSGADFHADLEPDARDVVMPGHPHLSAFGGGALAARLATSKVCRVVIAGARTEVEIDSTARDAVELGLQATIVADCCVPLTAAGHRSSVATTFPRVVHRVCTLPELERAMTGA